MHYYTLIYKKYFYRAFIVITNAKIEVTMKKTQPLARVTGIVKFYSDVVIREKYTNYKRIIRSN